MLLRIANATIILYSELRTALGERRIRVLILYEASRREIL